MKIYEHKVRVALLKCELALLIGLCLILSLLKDKDWVWSSYFNLTLIHHDLIV